MKTIFVSSTFRDMDLERDAIQERVYPMLNREARRHGQSISFCDLRWGIDTSRLESESGSKKVLDVCLDEIDRCQPPMVVILGYRYGWIPSAQLVRSTADRYRMALEDLEKSVTALEIEYGALADPARLENTLFYFREIRGEIPAEYRAEDEDHARRIGALKERILRLTGGRVKTYTLHRNGEGFTGIEEFADLLCADLRNVMLPQWEQYDTMTPFQKECHTHETYLREKAKAFRARKELAQQVIREIEEGKRLTVLKGDVGSGKSTLFSYIALELEKTGWEVFPLFSNLTVETGTAVGVLQLMVQYLMEQLEVGEKTETAFDLPDSGLDEVRNLVGDREKKQTKDVKDWQRQLEELCAQFSKTGRKLVFMIDAVDQLFDDGNRDRLVFIPQELNENIRFLITCLPEVAAMGHPFTQILPVDEQDKHRVIRGILTAHNRELSETVENAMVQLLGADNPLYLSFLVQRLLMMNREDFADIRSLGDGMDAISRHQLSVLAECPRSLGQMSAELIETAARRVGGHMVRQALTFLALAPHGLRVSDLASLLGITFSMLDFAHFISYMNDCFVIRNDGRYDFSHKSIREGLLRQISDPKAGHARLLSHFAALDAEDEIRIQEIIYHCIRSDDKAFFVAYLQKYLMETAPCRWAARQAYEACVKDGGRWLCDVLDMDMEDETQECIIKFLYSPFASQGENRLGELRTLYTVAKKNLDLAEKRVAAEPSVKNRFLLVYCLKVCSGYMMILGGGEMETQAHRMIIRRREIAKSLMEDHPSNQMRRMYAASCQAAALLEGGAMGLFAEDQAKLMEEALALRQTLADTSGKRSDREELAEQYLVMAKQYGSWLHPNSERAKQCAQKARELCDELYAESGSDSDLMKKVDVLDAFATIEKLEGETGIGQRKEALEILKKLALGKNTIYNRSSMAFEYSKILEAMHLTSQMDGEMAALARESNDERIRLYRSIVAERGSIQDRKNLARAYEDAVKNHPWTGECWYPQEERKRLIREAIRIREELYREISIESQKLELAMDYLQLGYLYDGDKTPEGDVCARKCYEKSESFGMHSKIFAYNEVLEVLRHMDEKFVNLIPVEMVMFLYSHLDLRDDIRFSDHYGLDDISPDAKAILSLINTKYWEGRV